MLFLCCEPQFDVGDRLKVYTCLLNVDLRPCTLYSACCLLSCISLLLCVQGLATNLSKLSFASFLWILSCTLAPLQNVYRGLRLSSTASCMPSAASFTFCYHYWFMLIHCHSLLGQLIGGNFCSCYLFACENIKSKIIHGRVPIGKTLIFEFKALSQTPAKAARPQTQGQCVW